MGQGVSDDIHVMDLAVEQVAALNHFVVEPRFEFLQSAYRVELPRA